jgi:predicted dienelactone hydrolase
MDAGWDAGSGSSRHGAVMLGRRGFLATAAAVTGGVIAAAPVGAARAAEASTAQRARLRLALPAPSGPYPVGTVALHLIDNSRQDPFLSAPRPRELMISLWYPALRQQFAGSRHGVVPWIPPPADTLLLAQLIPQPLVPVTLPGGGTGYEPGPPVSISLDGVGLPVTAARLGAPVAPLPGGCPVLLYSPGEQVDREFGTTQAEDLASHGYIVASIDHTYEAPEVVFPGGRIAVQVNPQPSQTTVLTTRIADAQFVLDSLAALAGGINPDAEHRPLPAGLAGALDLPKTGMFGHSLGGDTAAQVMAVDDRVVAGLDLDGTIEPAVPFTPPQIDQLATDVAQKLDGRPFMFLCSAGVTPFKTPGKPEAAGIPGFWQGLSGWRLFLSMNDSAHFSYTDYEAFLSQLSAAGIITPSQASEVVTPYIGTIAPAQAIAAQRAYIGAFFDLQLRHHNSHLLDGPSGRYPEIEFVA